MIACRQRHGCPVYKATDEKWLNIGKGESKEKTKEEYKTRKPQGTGTHRGQGTGTGGA